MRNITISKDRYTLFVDDKKVVDGIFGRGMLDYINVVCDVNAQDITISNGCRGHRFLIGTGGCCHGCLLVTEVSGYVQAVQPIDFNIVGALPVVHEIVGHEGKPFRDCGVLVWGAGCSGSGVRFVSRLWSGAPTVTVVVPTSEASSRYHSWLYCSGILSMVPDIFDRMKAIGIRVLKEENEQLGKNFSYPVRPWQHGG